MITKLNTVKKILNQAGIKPTFQRIAVLSLMESQPQHLTADEIYNSLLLQVPTFSKTTVYNTLNTLLKEELVHNVTITGSEVHYGFGKGDHHHLYCLKCHQIFDIHVSCPFTREMPNLYEGHEILEIHGYFKGICKNCLKNEER